MASSRFADAEAAAREADGLAEGLRAWRRCLAQGMGVPPYVIFPDRTLDALAEGGGGDLEAVPGIGPAKRARYGESLLRVLGE